MLKNYIRIALRNISRNKLYSALNIIGLAIGIACCFLILFYIQDELSYDRFNDKADRIVRIVPTFTTSERTMHMATNAHVMGPLIKDEFPEVENYVRFTDYGAPKVLTRGDISFSEEKFLWADGSVFDIFSFELLQGNPKEALVNPNTLVISVEAAEKYFGEKSPLGESIRVNHNALYTVTGVMKNIPKTSHITPDILASFSTLGLKPSKNMALDLVNRVNYYTYFLLNPGTDNITLQQKISESINNKLAPILKALGGTAELELQPLPRIYLHSDRENELERTGDLAYIWLFAGIGAFILLLACLNFMNLSTARSANRAKEVGLRKVVGAQKSQLVRQFLGESLILTLLAFLLSALIVIASMPVFQNISGKALSLKSLINPELLLGLFGLFVIISLLGGSYPAFFLSAFRPVEVIQGTLRRGVKSPAMRIVLVSFQFAVSIILIIGTFTVSRQLNYIRSKNLGYDKEHVIAIRMRNPETQKKFEAVKEAVRRHPSVLNVSASNSTPLGFNDFSVHHAEGKPETESVMLFATMADEDFIDTYRIEIVQGRNFSKEFPTDPGNAILINEAAVKKLGWQDGAIGKHIDRYASMTKRVPHEIIGIVKDYHFQSLHESIQPLMIYYSNPYGNYTLLSVRARPENIQDTVTFLKTTWKQFDSQFPFEFSFVDDQYDAMYRTEARLGKLFGYFTTLAVLIGCLGLFGLTSFTAEQRTKEIGIRKVLGASVPGVFFLLVRDFTKWVILAVVVAWPIGYFVMRDWLQNFAYRTSLGIWIFLSAALLALVVSVLTVSYQSVKAALANPADSLKYE